MGQESLVDGLILGLLADGHILIEGVPGLAKTRVVNLLANICNVAFKRLQFTLICSQRILLGLEFTINQKQALK